MTKCLTDGKMHLKSDSCEVLAGVKKLNATYPERASFKGTFSFFAQSLSYRGLDHRPQLHEHESGNTATISLRYKVPAQPAGKVPTRLSPKLKP